MGKIYDGPGKARKVCVGCGAYIHCRELVCPKCEHSFDKTGKTKVKKVNKPKVHTSAGRGRKVCPSCHKFVGVRSSTCSICNHVFKKVTTTTKPVVQKEVVVGEVPKQTTKIIPTNVENDAFEDVNENKLNLSFVDSIKGYNKPLILVPRGDSPIKIYGRSDVAYNLFCRTLVEYGLENGVVYTPRAIRYFGRDILGANTQEYKAFVKVVDSYVDTLINGEDS